MILPFPITPRKTTEIEIYFTTNSENEFFAFVDLLAFLLQIHDDFPQDVTDSWRDVTRKFDDRQVVRILDIGTGLSNNKFDWGSDRVDGFDFRAEDDAHVLTGTVSEFGA